MAAKQSEKTGGIPLELRMHGFPRSMLFNRFEIERDGEMRLLHFGYVNKANVLLDHFIGVVHLRDLEVQKESNMDYLGRLGSLSLEIRPAWQPPATSQRLELVNQIGLCRFGEAAEVVFHRFPIKALLDSARPNKSSTTLVADPVAILRSEIELHKHFVQELYND